MLKRQSINKLSSEDESVKRSFVEGSVAVVFSELLERLPACLNGQLAELSREVQLYCCLNLFAGESLFLGENHKIASLSHDLLEEFYQDEAKGLHR